MRVVIAQITSSYQAGQYLFIHSLDGEKRPFSIANAPLGTIRLELHIRHSQQNDYSTRLLAEIKSTGKLNIQGPQGQCIYSDHSKPLIFLASGTGFAPHKAIIENILAQDAQQNVHLFWCANSESDLYLDELPQHWAHTVPHFRYTPVLYQPECQQQWHGEIGLGHNYITQYYPDLSHHLIYIAGTPEMVKSARVHFLQHGAFQNQLFSDV